MDSTSGENSTAQYSSPMSLEKKRRNVFSAKTEDEPDVRWSYVGVLVVIITENSTQESEPGAVANAAQGSDSVCNLPSIIDILSKSSSFRSKSASCTRMSKKGGCSIKLQHWQPKLNLSRKLSNSKLKTVLTWHSSFKELKPSLPSGRPLSLILRLVVKRHVHLISSCSEIDHLIQPSSDDSPHLEAAIEVRYFANRESKQAWQSLSHYSRAHKQAPIAINRLDTS